MSQPDPIIFRELAVIHRIIADETWLEGERRGRPVASDDPVVRENVCQVILRIGQQLRESFMHAESSEADGRSEFAANRMSGRAA